METGIWKEEYERVDGRTKDEILSMIKKKHWCYARSWKAGVQITTTEIAPDFEKVVTCRMVYEVSQYVEEQLIREAISGK